MLGFHHCTRCATDLRVRIEPRDAENVQVRLDVWQCFGGLDLEKEEPMVRNTYDHSHREWNLRAGPPSRQLEILYDEGAYQEGFSASTSEPQVSSGRRT